MGGQRIDFLGQPYSGEDGFFSFPFNYPRKLHLQGNEANLYAKKSPVSVCVIISLRKDETTLSTRGFT